MWGFLIPGIPLTAIGSIVLIVGAIILFGSAMVNQDLDGELALTVSKAMVWAIIPTGLGSWFLYLGT